MSKDGLITLKLTAGRAQDLVDIQSPAATTSIEARPRAALVSDYAHVREGVDMSASAVSDRLRVLAEMSSVCLQLASLQPR